MRIAYVTVAVLVLAAATAILNLGRIKIAIHNKRGADYYHKGMYDKAMAEFQKAIMIKPDYAEAHNNLGVIYRAKGMYEIAMDEFQMAIRFKPKFAIAYYNLARTYSQSNDRRKSIESLRRAIHLNDKFIDFAISEKAFENIRDSLEFRELIGGKDEKKTIGR
ncbi:MAG: tetratricopeptide repeat protein [Candidatus Poribacteria bacterium]